MANNFPGYDLNTGDEPRMCELVYFHFMKHMIWNKKYRNIKHLFIIAIIKAKIFLNSQPW